MKNQHHRVAVKHPPSFAGTEAARYWKDALESDPQIGPRIREVRAILAKDAPSRRTKLLETLSDGQWHGNKALGASEEDIDVLRAQLKGTGHLIVCQRALGWWGWGYRLYPTLAALQEADDDWHGPEHAGACYSGPCIYCKKLINGILYYHRTRYWKAVDDGLGIGFDYAHKTCHERATAPEEGICSVCGITGASYNHLQEAWFCDADNPNLQTARAKRALQMERRLQREAANASATNAPPQ